MPPGQPQPGDPRRRAHHQQQAQQAPVRPGGHPGCHTPPAGSMIQGGQVVGELAQLPPGAGRCGARRGPRAVPARKPADGAAASQSAEARDAVQGAAALARRGGCGYRGDRALLGALALDPGSRTRRVLGNSASASPPSRKNSSATSAPARPGAGGARQPMRRARLRQATRRRSAAGRRARGVHLRGVQGWPQGRRQPGIHAWARCPIGGRPASNSFRRPPANSQRPDPNRASAFARP